MSGLSKKTAWFRSAWLIIGLGVVAVLAAGSFTREIARNRQINREIAALKDESERLQARNFELLSMGASLDKPDFLEREARLKLNLRKEGERVVVLRQAPTSSSPLVSAAPEVWSNPHKWWVYFTDRQAYDEHLRASRTNP